MSASVGAPASDFSRWAAGRLVVAALEPRQLEVHPPEDAIRPVPLHRRVELENKPNYVFILGGTNDLGTGVSQATIIANLRAIITDSIAHKVVPIVINVPPDTYSSMAPKIDSLNAAIVHLANAYKVVVVDIHTPLSSASGTYQARYTSDGLHLSSLGAQVVANTIYSRVRRLGI